MFIIKIDAQGNILWTKNYGGVLDDGATGICQQKDGNYMVLGYTYNFGAGDRDMYLLKINVNGDSLLAETYGGALLTKNPILLKQRMTGELFWQVIPLALVIPNIICLR